MLLSQIAPTPTKSAVDPHTAVLLRRITSGHLLAIAPDVKGGLLLIKPFFVDFVGPGGAVGGEFDRSCIAVYPVGTVRCQPLLTKYDRQEAIQTRITCAEQLAAICDRPHARDRADQIIQQLADWLPGNLSLLIPAELTAGLVGVLPDTIRLAWQTPNQERQMPKALAPAMPLRS